MQVLQEDTVRQLHLRQGKTEIHVGPETYVTQQAREYIKDKRLELVVDGAPGENREIRPAPEMAAGGFRTLEGASLDKKPEHMTHLYGNVLVPKSHPRIALRGWLDRLEAEIVDLQARMAAGGEAELAAGLEEVLGLCHSMMSSEVTGKPLPPWKLFGLDSDGLRAHSQHPQKYFGIGHLMPSYRLGPWIAGLNRLRTLSRQAELAAVGAFVRPDGSAEREDLLLAYNRMSSAFYVLMLRQASSAGKGGLETHE